MQYICKGTDLRQTHHTIQLLLCLTMLIGRFSYCQNLQWLRSSWMNCWGPGNAIGAHFHCIKSRVGCSLALRTRQGLSSLLSCLVGPLKMWPDKCCSLIRFIGGAGTSAGAGVMMAWGVPGAGRWGPLHRRPSSWSPAGCSAACPGTQMTCAGSRSRAGNQVLLHPGLPCLQPPEVWRMCARSLHAICISANAANPSLQRI